MFSLTPFDTFSFCIFKIKFKIKLFTQLFYYYAYQKSYHQKYFTFFTRVVFFNFL